MRNIGSTKYANGVSQDADGNLQAVETGSKVFFESAFVDGGGGGGDSHNRGDAILPRATATAESSSNQNSHDSHPTHNCHKITTWMKIHMMLAITGYGETVLFLERSIKLVF